MADLALQQEWEKRVAEFQASGLSAAKWCEANGYKAHQLYYWVRKFRKAGMEKAEPTKWLQLGADESCTDGLRVKVGQAVVEVQHGFNPELLIEVVRTLSVLC